MNLYLQIDIELLLDLTTAQTHKVHASYNGWNKLILKENINHDDPIRFLIFLQFQPKLQYLMQLNCTNEVNKKDEEKTRNFLSFDKNPIKKTNI